VDHAPPTVGVEEEYLLLDDRGEPVPAFERVHRFTAAAEDGNDEVEPELLTVQVEVATPTCTALEDIGSNLRRLRREVADAAGRAGCSVAAVGAASRFGSALPPATDKDRYRRMHANAPRLVDEMLVNGMHVHVGIDDPADRIRVLNGLRPWLPVFVALSANSPYWDGQDCGFSSWRTVHFTRWPVSGPPPLFDGPDDYEQRITRVTETGALVDRGQLYWQARLSQTYPTVEIRVADVQLTADEATLLAGLLRGLVARLLRGEVRSPIPTEELLRSTVWQAARDGLSGSLLHPLDLQQRPADEVVATLLECVRPALQEAGDADLVERLLENRITGAERQRAAYEDGGLDGVLRLVTEQFTAGC
jgi:carboxylate-amine ligase